VKIRVIRGKKAIWVTSDNVYCVFHICSMPLIEVNGLKLFYKTEGQSSTTAPVLLFLHGLGSSSTDWALQSHFFSQRYRLLMVDLRAHGRSRHPGGRLTIEMMADDVDGLLARLEIASAHVVGLSLGGCVALTLALRHPARVRSLILVNTFARLQPAGLGGLFRMLTRVWLLLFAPMPVIAAHVAQGLFPKSEQVAYYKSAVASLSQNSKRAYLSSIRALLGFDLREQVGMIQCPTLVMAGDRDRTIPLAAKEALCRSIPGAQLCVIPDSGHATPYDQTELFNRAVDEFIRAQ
jgi:pimeloyl-ACP methyl ester carboxylesterase